MCCPVSRWNSAWPVLFSVWIDYVGWPALVLGIQVCRRAGIKVICIWLLVLSIVARACQSFKMALASGVGRLKPSWWDVYSSNVHVLGREWYWSSSCRYLGEDSEFGMSVFLALALVSQLVLWCVIGWSRVRLSVGYWLSCCCALDFPLCDSTNQCLPFYSILFFQ